MSHTEDFKKEKKLRNRNPKTPILDNFRGKKTTISTMIFHNSSFKHMHVPEGEFDEKWRSPSAVLQELPAFEFKQSENRRRSLGPLSGLTQQHISTPKSDRKQENDLRSRYTFRRSRSDVGFSRAKSNSGENCVLSNNHDASNSFSKEVYECLPKLPWKISRKDLASRKDLRHLPICSVDIPGCCSIDDAFHSRRLENGHIEIGVHIADVTHFVHPGTALDDEARKRRKTSYILGKRRDMLPRVLTYDLCSLKENCERLAFSIMWKLNEQAEVVQVSFFKSLIKSRASLTYADAEVIIKERTKSDDVTKSLKLLSDLSKFFRRNWTHGPAKNNVETLVGTYMKLANDTVGKTIFKAFPNYAMLRTNGFSQPLTQGKTTENNRYYSSGSLSKQLTVDNFSESISTHFTSPIRRYADVIVHLAMAAVIGFDDAYIRLFDPDKLQQLCEHLNNNSLQ